ncbi:MAG: thioredoxin fold domain-containing protein [Betaproteobacteria bacterium]|nr:thioredoxin fold domain-containing protein [Betaproteobacteria bacterium]
MDRRTFFAFAAAAVLAAPEAHAMASDAAPSGVFQESFLVFPDEVRDAAKAGKRVIVFIEQEGCVYCQRMAEVTFADPQVRRLLESRFYMVALDLYGSRDTVWVDGRKRSEKALARHLEVRGTPTILLLDEHGAVLWRLVGYRAPREFLAVLEQTRG